MLDLLSELEQLKSNAIIMDYEDLADTVDSFIRRKQLDEFYIAVVGEFSSGKSTFINSIIGKDVLKHAVGETTATITYIRNIPAGDSHEGYCQINYADGRVQELSNTDDLAEYTTTMAKNNDVASEIVSVDIYTHFLNTDRQVVLVDTPGLNGTADKHRAMTIKLIKEAHACIYMMQLRGLSDSDVEFLKVLVKYQHLFVFVQNFIDEIKLDEQETVGQKLDETKNIVHERLDSLADAELRTFYCGISSLKALAGRDANIKYLYDGDKKEIDAGRRKELMASSGYVEFAKLLTDIVNDEKINAQLYIDQCRNILVLLREAKQRGEWKQADYEAVAQESDEYKRIEKAKERLKRLEDKKVEIWQKLQDMIGAKFSDARKLLNKDIEDNIEKIRGEVTEDLEKYQDFATLEKDYQNGKIRNKILTGQTAYEGSLREKKATFFQGIYKDTLASLNSYTSDVAATNVDVKFKFEMENNIENKQEGKVISYSDKINDWKGKMKQFESSVEYNKREKASLQNQIAGQEQSKRNIVSDLNNLSNRLSSGLSRLGNRPAPQTRTITKYRDRTGFLSFITNSLFGKKEYTETVIDDSNVREWEQARASVYSNNNRERTLLNSRLRDKQNEISKLEQKKEESEQKIISQQRQIERAKREIKILQDEKAEFERLAKSENLKMMKAAMVKYVQEYLVDSESSVQNALRKQLEREIKNNEKRVAEEIKKIFDRTVSKKIRLYNAQIASDKQGLERECKDYSGYIKALKNFEGKLREEIA